MGRSSAFQSRDVGSSVGYELVSPQGSPLVDPDRWNERVVAHRVCEYVCVWVLPFEETCFKVLVVAAGKRQVCVASLTSVRTS